MPHVVRAQDKSAEGRRLWRLLQGFLRQAHLSACSPRRRGIAVESIAEPTGEAWLVQLQQAAQANVAPADVSMMSQTSTLKGHGGRSLGAARSGEDADSTANVKPEFVSKYAGRPRRRRRRGDLVHHARLQHQRLSDGAGLLGLPVGSRRTPTSSGCWRSSPTRSCWRSRRRPSSAATPRSSTPTRASSR